MIPARILVVVGSGGVGKTTLAAVLGVAAAKAARDTLVMTFDPSLRLKDALGVGEAARDAEVRVPLNAPGALAVSLLDASGPFDRLVRRYAPDAASRDRILSNRLFRHLAGSLAGVLEYMAVGRLGRGAEAFLDRMVGLDLLRDMAEFFQAFAPLYEGLRTRAEDVHALLREPETIFVRVNGPAPEHVAETMFFARRLEEAGHHLGPVVVNRVHPRVEGTNPGLPDDRSEGRQLVAWLGERDRRGVEELRSLLDASRQPMVIPLLDEQPTNLAVLGGIGKTLLADTGGAHAR